MTPRPVPVHIEIPDLPDVLYAGERTPVTLVLTRPADALGSVQARNVRTSRPEAILDADLFQRDITLAPGESYRTTLLLEVTRPCQFGLGDLEVQVDSALYPLGERTLPVRPSLRHQVKACLEPICTYEQGAKVLLLLRHEGVDTLEDVQLLLEPAAAVRAGKSAIYWDRIDPGQEKALEIVVAANRLLAHLRARIGTEWTEVSWELPVSAAPVRATGKHFRFLEPRKLSIDQVSIYPLEQETGPPIAPSQGIFPLQGKQHYRVVIRPSHPGATEVHLRELPELVLVNRSATSGQSGCWQFEIFLPTSQWFTQSARLLYDVKAPGGDLQGELYLKVCPPPYKRLGIAAALGAAVTVQSVSLFLHALFSSDLSWGALWARLNPFSDLYSLYFLSIPCIWLSLHALDWLQYRWRR